MEAAKIYDASLAVQSNISVPRPDGLNYFPHQLAAIDFIDSVPNRHVLVADPPGLGKTPTAIGYCNLKPDIQKILVICPASLTETVWLREFEQWSVQKRQYDVFRKGSQELTSRQVIITSYDMARNAGLMYYIRKAWGSIDLLILDEAHYLKNPKAKRTNVALSRSGFISISKECIALTGTPIVNRPIEIFPLIRSMCPQAVDYKPYLEFAFRYCNAKYSDYGLDVSGYSNLKELGRKLRSSFMVRRAKKAVLEELPDKIVNVVSLSPTKISEKIIAKQAKFNASEVLKAKGTVIGFEGLSETRRLLGDEKIKPAVEYIKAQLLSREKVIIFAHHKAVITSLSEAFKGECVVITGGTPNNHRADLVARFQTDPQVKVFIGSITACGVGITLTASSYVCFVECSWVSGENEQAEDRAHRIGQKDSVVVDYLVFKDSLDENILKAQTYKAIQIRGIVDKKPQPMAERKEESMHLDQAKLAMAMAAISTGFAEAAKILAGNVEASQAQTEPVAAVEPEPVKKKAPAKKKAAKKVAPKPEPTPEPTPEPEEEPLAPLGGGEFGEDFGDLDDLGDGGETPAISEEDCREQLKAVARKNGKPDAIKLLQKYEVGGVADLPEAQREAFMADAKARLV